MRNDVIQNIGFGCVSLSALSSLKEALKVLDTAFDCGIRWFDTAPLYGNGYSEVILGKFLRGKRKYISLSTKFGLNSDRTIRIPAVLALRGNYLKKKIAPLPKRAATVDTNHAPGSSSIRYRKIDRAEIETSFITSLRMLKTEYINNFLLHEAIPSFLTDEALNYVLNLKQEGKILNLGIAANSENIAGCDVDSWDILQYENGRLFNSDYLLKRFPGKLHVYHSVLKNLKNTALTDAQLDEMAALLLLNVIKKNPSGKVLFASTKYQTIINNLAGIEKYGNLTLAEIKLMIDALS